MRNKKNLFITHILLHFNFTNAPQPQDKSKGKRLVRIVHKEQKTFKEDKKKKIADQTDQKKSGVDEENQKTGTDEKNE